MIPFALRSAVTSRRTLGRCARLSAAVVFSLGLLGASSGGAMAQQDVAHCVSPGGDDLNAIFGTEDALVVPFCTDVVVGQRWRAVLRVNVAGRDAVFPDPYQSSTADLVHDFLTKLISVTYVVDAGTATERTYVVAVEDLVVRAGGGPDGTRFVSWVAPSRHPLPPGDHTVEQYVTLSETFWDGLGLDAVRNQIPAGTSFATSTEFRVVKSIR